MFPGQLDINPGDIVARGKEGVIGFEPLKGLMWLTLKVSVSDSVGEYRVY